MSNLQPNMTRHCENDIAFLRHRLGLVFFFLQTVTFREANHFPVTFLRHSVKHARERSAGRALARAWRLYWNRNVRRKLAWHNRKSGRAATRNTYSSICNNRDNGSNNGSNARTSHPTIPAEMRHISIKVLFDAKLNPSLSKLAYRKRSEGGLSDEEHGDVDDADVDVGAAHLQVFALWR